MDADQLTLELAQDAPRHSMQRLVLPCGVTLYNADCMAVIGEINADAVVTDPPFGSTACHWDQHLDWPLLWPMLWDSLGEDGVIALHSAQPFTHPLIASQIQHHKYSWIWQKNLATNFFHAKRQPLRSHEEINVFYRKCGRYYPQMSEGHKPTQSAKGSSVGQLWHGTNKRDYEGGVTTRHPQTVLPPFPVVDPKCRVHPSEKPVDLLEYLVRTYTKEGETVLDFSMGSGSTAIACLRSGRKFVGIERDTEIFNTAKERIISWQNVRCGGTAAKDSQSEANEGAYPPLPPTTCSPSYFSDAAYARSLKVPPCSAATTHCLWAESQV